MTSISSPSPRSAPVNAVADPIAQVLVQLAEVLETLTDEQYTMRPVGKVESSIGAHVRHCLDHVRELLVVPGAGAADFDARRRDTDVERSRAEALAEVARLRAGLSELPEGIVNLAVSVNVLMSVGDEPVTLRSSFGREAAFVLSHTIHHYALLAAMVKTLGAPLPERFGYAPATVKAGYAPGGAACAR